MKESVKWLWVWRLTPDLPIQSTVEFWFETESLESIWDDLELETNSAIKLLSSWTMRDIAWSMQLIIIKSIFLKKSNSQIEQKLRENNNSDRITVSQTTYVG